MTLASPHTSPAPKHKGRPRTMFSAFPYDKRINEKDDKKIYLRTYLTKRILQKKRKNISKVLSFKFF